MGPDKLLRLIFCAFCTLNFLAEVTSIILNQTDVQQYAEQIGLKLWKIGSEITKRGKIAKRYQEMNASVEVTDGDEILKTIAVRMNRLIKEKVDAVLRIKNAAMDAESNSTSLTENDENMEYYNSKFSNTTINDKSNLITTKFNVPKDNQNYTTMYLSKDRHFDDVLVNITHSSVHVPTNIFDRWSYVIRPIIWSQNLDKAFLKNYEDDSSLMWQYFASTSGFLRHFPAFHWKIPTDRFDCRRQIWYTQAATCSKEVVILVDNSGTMYGMRNTIAQLTVDSLLQTFSNNDYINILRLFEENVTCLVPCFEDTLIQATPENIELFRKFLYDMCPEKKINYKVALTRAFTMLHEFLLNRTENANENRNQAVFLLTDMLIPDKEMIEIRNEYEKIYNDTNIQVELFIYFIGQDINDVQEVQWEKCLRKGSLIHVRTMDEVPEDALKYLSILARTQNESTEYYPISWTHAFLDVKKDKGKPIDDIDDETDNEGELYKTLTDHRLMTAVTTPVYSKNKNKTLNANNEQLIGVAAIEVPISDFERLTMPHKIGVNGYAFIVTNNGYLLSHPDLRPFQDGNLRHNFNSMDLTEVEFYDNEEHTARNPHPKIFELRRRMVNQELGNETDLKIKFHFDNQKRVGSEIRHYFFAPLKCSPFSVGLALPTGYGNYWVKPADEINKSKAAKEDYKQFFKGNWQIHPNWSYCDYRNNKKYTFKSAKDKLMTFFDMIFNDETFVWIEEHPNELINITSLNSTEFESCFAKDTTEKPEKDYYCDKELVELLYFDAKLTQEEFPQQMTKENAEFMDENKIRLRFVATQGGLTRWQTYPENYEDQSFGGKCNKALDEVWYKSAVLLHETDSPKFVFSIPEDASFKNKTEKFITATHAIFYSEEGHEAPGVVVGFQITFDFLKREIEDIPSCGKNPSGNRYDCYVIDSNGFIIYAQKEDDIGKFFGTITGGADAMLQMVEYKIFRKIPMFDYQALEKKNKNMTTSSSSHLPNPFSFITRSVGWVFTHLVWFLIQINIWQYIAFTDACTVESNSNSNNTSCTYKTRNRTCQSCRKAPKAYEDRCKTREVLAHIESEDDYYARTDLQPVDKKFTLFLYTNLSATRFAPKNGSSCSRPFHAARINQTNLILLLVDTLHETCDTFLSIKQEVIKYEQVKGDPVGDIPACHKKMINSYPRKKLRGCSDKIIQNRTREDCGAGNHIASNWSILISSAFIFIISSSFIM